jgi:hypothetical protein
MKRIALALLLLAPIVLALPADFDPRIPGWYAIRDDEVNVCRVFGGRDAPVDEEPTIDVGGTAQTIDLPTETTATLQAIRRADGDNFFYEFEYFIDPIIPLTVSFFIEEGEAPSDTPSPVNFLFNRELKNGTFDKYNFTSPALFHSIIIAYQGERVSLPIVTQ